VELAQSPAGARLEFYEGSPSHRAASRRATPLFRRAPRRPWPPERPASQFHRAPTVPPLAGTVTRGQSQFMAYSAGRPPGGSPEGGSASLEAMGGGVHDGIGALPDGIGLCPLAIVPATAGHGGGTVELARRLCGGIVRILRQRGRATLWRPPVGYAPIPGCTGGEPIPPVPPCGGIVRILQRLSEPPGTADGRPPVASDGWLGLSGRHGRRGA